MINVAILGNGTVGAGVVELINKNKEYIKSRTGKNVGISKILVRNIEKHIGTKSNKLITNDIDEIFKSKPDIVVEAIGGINPAYDYIKGFLKEKKHVITANKDVIAKHGAELSELAKENGVSLRFEASVGGGIPILKPVQESLAGNDIQYIYAILNGTTNFILSKMYSEGSNYDDALKIAQDLGFAEANPASDVLGYDSARKLAILSSISYGELIDWEKINTEGITEIDDVDIKLARDLGCTIKLLAISRKEKESIYAAVRPVLVPEHSTLGKIENEFNGVVLEGDAVGEVFFYGKGAGKKPTASAVMGDIFDVLENKNQKPMLTNTKQAEVLSKWQGGEAQWLVSINCIDKDSAVSILKNNFEDLDVLSDLSDLSENVSVLLKCSSEEKLEDVLKEVSKNIEVKSIKKLMKLDI
ncbi:MAG: homoserine dehydrogenase [Clostridiaceae bacterium]